ncbi:MAG: sigma-70 family RNA polymerase sigma factor [Planctomycetaceae bacterium]|nr:sigma-70 family RNA polymerase sigma factor [Planctomycetaceae bacterium]
MGARRMEEVERTDEMLVEEARAGRAAAFQELVERHQDRIFRLVRQYARQPAEVEDLAQDTFLKAFRRLDSFAGQASFATWLHRIAVNTCLDNLKRKSRSPVVSAEDPELIESESGRPARAVVAPDARMDQEEIAAVTRRALEELPEIFRTVLVLREFEELSYQEMAETLGISIGTIESRLFRARARFRVALTELYPEYAEDQGRPAKGSTPKSKGPEAQR